MAENDIIKVSGDLNLKTPVVYIMNIWNEIVKYKF